MFWVLAITTRQEWHSISFGLLYWLPNPLQFGSFLLLPMAYSKVIINAYRTRFFAMARQIGEDQSRRTKERPLPCRRNRCTDVTPVC